MRENPQLQAQASVCLWYEALPETQPQSYHIVWITEHHKPVQPVHKVSGHHALERRDGFCVWSREVAADFQQGWVFDHGNSVG